jgi:hypothetical protein
MPLSVEEFAPFVTLRNRFYAWEDDSLWEQILSAVSPSMTIRETRTSLFVNHSLTAMVA